MSGLEIPKKFERGAHFDPDRAAESATFLIGHVCDVLGLPSLESTELLDVGCGTKFTGAFMNDKLPIKKYVGVDVYDEMIEFLREEVTDARFEFSHINVRNELYNPDAPEMTATTDLGVADQTFDLIWLFSVFTHLNPEDYRIMLKVLRRYIRPDGHLFFTVFLNERTTSGHGAVEGIARGLEQAIAEGRELPPDVIKQLELGPVAVEPFMDLDSEHPLRVAMYSREYALELVDGTGWIVDQVLEPNEFAQHQFLCSPVPS